MAKKVVNFEKLKIENLIIENKKLIIKKKDILRKYNQRYGTSYILDTTTLDVKDPKLYKKLENITTKNLKGSGTVTVSEISVVRPKYNINGVELSEYEYKRMKALEAKANKLRGKTFSGGKYYNAYFTTERGYRQYIKILEKASTQEGYLEGIKNGLLTFKDNVENHLGNLMDVASTEEDMEVLKDLAEWVNTYWDTFSRIDKAYKFIKASGYTAEQMARLFFDSDPKRSNFQTGEDVQFIEVMKALKKKYHWSSEGRITNLELNYPITKKQAELARAREL